MGLNQDSLGRALGPAWPWRMGILTFPASGAQGLEGLPWPLGPEKASAAAHSQLPRFPVGVRRPGMRRGRRSREALLRLRGPALPARAALCPRGRAGSGQAEQRWEYTHLGPPGTVLATGRAGVGEERQRNTRAGWSPEGQLARSRVGRRQHAGSGGLQSGHTGGQPRGLPGFQETISGLLGPAPNPNHAPPSRPGTSALAQSLRQGPPTQRQSGNAEQARDSAGPHPGPSPAPALPQAAGRDPGERP